MGDPTLRGVKKGRGRRRIVALLTPMSIGVILALSDLLQLLFDIDVAVIYQMVLASLPVVLAVYAAPVFGWRFVGKAFTVLFLGGLAVEVFGTSTGIPFAEYSYTDRLQPQLFGVPVQIPLAWFFLGVMSYSMASLNHTGRVRRVVLASALMVSWDVLYDPIFTAHGFWSWRQGSYFGVPITNFLGWLFSSILFFSIIEAVSHNDTADTAVVAKLSPATLYSAYIVDGVTSNLILHQTSAAIIGGLLMTITFLTVHVRYWKSLRYLRHAERRGGGA